MVLPRSIHHPIVLLLLSLATLLGACALLEERIAPTQDRLVLTRNPEPAYEAMIPYYAEACALTQFRRLDGVLGGSPGHAVMYLKGVCRDADAPYPTLVLCESSETDPFNKNHGVGISVSRLFKNANWVAIPGKRLFMDGDLAPHERLTVERYEAVLQESVDLGLFRGIVVHPKYARKVAPGQSLEEYIAAESTGTDFALRFARTTFCTRLPITEPQMLAMMQYLNALNEEYATGRADYNWNGYSDNCVHTLHNALAAASVWKPKSVARLRLRGLFNLAVPANVVIELGSLANFAPLDDWRKLRGNELQREALSRYDWLPMRSGALLSSFPIHQDNDVFDTKLKLLTLSRSFGFSANRKAEKLRHDARTTELESNLRWFRQRYEEIAAAKGDRPRPMFDHDDDAELEARYDAYIEEQLASVQAQLAGLAELRAELRKR